MAASRNRPQDTEGHLSGDTQPRVNLRSGFGKAPPSLHTLSGCGSSSCLAVRWDRNAGQNPLYDGARQAKGWEERRGMICVGCSSEGHRGEEAGNSGRQEMPCMASVGQEGEGLVLDFPSG